MRTPLKAADAPASACAGAGLERKNKTVPAAKSAPPPTKEMVDTVAAVIAESREGQSLSVGLHTAASFESLFFEIAIAPATEPAAIPAIPTPPSA